MAKKSNNKAKAEQKPNKPTKEEIEKAAYDWAVFLYDVYQEKKRKEAENGTN